MSVALRSLSRDMYEALSEGGGSVPVFREMPGDLLTPVSAFLAIEGSSERAFLLESVVGGESVARYSFLGAGPKATIEMRQGRLSTGGTDLLGALRKCLGPRAAEVPGLPRFTGGLVGYLGYDAVRLFEHLPSRHPPADLPEASFSFYGALVAFDHAQQRILLIAHAQPGSAKAYADAQASLDELQGMLLAPRRMTETHSGFEGAGSLEDEEGFRRSVAEAKEFIVAGDIFQVVLSRRRVLPCPVHPFAVYRALRMVNPSPYMYFLKEGETAIAGASPEMLVRVQSSKVETRPIAGTRPRGASLRDDQILAKELLADEKERAEHVMLVDLSRNDLGRVCRFGSVRVPELMNVERYSHVAHIVSSVVGDLAPGKDALDALVATFPAGTLTGAPKIRAMQIIDDLEPAGRGLYGGALGYLDMSGNLDFCIAIRTVVMQSGFATVQAGAGIVADSDPGAEARETEAKAGAMFEALRLSGGLG